MNSMQIERCAINAVEDSILSTGYLTPYLTDNDKEPSWDGMVYLYSNKSLHKENLKGRIHVQVKGKEEEDLSRKEISYPVEVVDLKNYLQDGGVIYFVVYLANQGRSKKIYYIELTPIRLRNLLKNISEGQKKKSLQFKEFPNDENAIIALFENFSVHSRKQKSFGGLELSTLDELQEKNLLEGITIPLTVDLTKGIESSLLSSDNYIYARIKGTSIEQPLDYVPKNPEIIKNEKAVISAGNKQFYSSFTKTHTIEQIKYYFGESLCLSYDEKANACKFNYKHSNMVRVLAKDLDFMINIYENGCFFVNDLQVEFSPESIDQSKFDIEEQRKLLKMANNITSLLDTLGCNKDLNINELGDHDWTNIERLFRGLICKEPIEIKLDTYQTVQVFAVGELRFLIYLEENSARKGTYFLHDFFTGNIQARAQLETGEDVSCSQYTILDKTNMNSFDNIRYEVLLPSFQNMEHRLVSVNRANLFLLDLISAYDESQNQMLLKTAKEFSEWLLEAKEEELPFAIKTLNRCQVLKRMGNLTDCDRKEIYSLIADKDSTDEILTGAYLLLDQQHMAELSFERLDDSQKEKFKEYPIYHFWKIQEKNEGINTYVKGIQ